MFLLPTHSDEEPNLLTSAPLMFPQGFYYFKVGLVNLRVEAAKVVSAKDHVYYCYI